MNNFEFCNPVKVVFGKGSALRNLHEGRGGRQREED